MQDWLSPIHHFLSFKVVPIIKFYVPLRITYFLFEKIFFLFEKKFFFVCVELRWQKCQIWAWPVLLLKTFILFYEKS
jgi:hypothetical protein